MKLFKSVFECLRIIIKKSLCVSCEQSTVNPITENVSNELGSGQNGDKSNLISLQNAVLNLSPFWLYPKRRHVKTATCTVLVCRRLEFVAVLDTSQHDVLDKLDCRRFGLSPFWELSPF